MSMRRARGIALSTLLTVLLAAPARGEVEVALWGGYQGGGSFDVEGGELHLPGAPSVGITVDVTVREDAQVELSYSRQATELRLRGGALAPSTTLMDMAVEYYQLGGLLEWPHARWRPFFAMTIGATRFAPEPADVASVWRFSGVLGGGTKLELTEHLRLRLQGRLLLPWISGSSSFFCSLPGGCLISVSGTVMAQGDVSAGLVAVF
jgi:hypothetical protein